MELKILKQLIAANTSNPPGNEYKAAKIVTEFFDEHKIKYKIISKNDARPNIIGYIGKGNPKLMIACHTDTVPAGKGWKTDPFKAVVKKGFVYGRGTIDNKGPLTSLLVAAKELKNVEKRLKGQLLIAAVADEEVGSEYGLKYVIKQIRPDYAIIPDVSGNMKTISVAEKGLLWLNIVFKGKQAHGARPDLGDNAIHKAVKFIGLINKYKMKFNPHPILSKPTINIGRINGGDAPNMVPGECSITLDIRLIPGQNKKIIVDEIKKIADKSGKNVMNILQYQEPTEVKDNNLINVIRKNAKKIGIKTKLIGLDGATVSKMLIKKGIPAVGFSIGDSKLGHQANERISIKEMKDFSGVLKNIVLDFLS